MTTKNVIMELINMANKVSHFSAGSRERDVFQCFSDFFFVFKSIIDEEINIEIMRV